MSARPDLCIRPASVAERRERVLELTRLGDPAWLIAHKMRIDMRTVQRYRDHERAGIPPGGRYGRGNRAP